MSLEVDQPGKEPVTYLDDRYEGKEAIYGPAYQPVGTQPPRFTSADHAFSKRRSPLILALLAALAIMTILAIVAAAVGGSTAIKRQSSIDRLRQQLDASNDALASSNNNHTSPSTSQPTMLSDIKPTSNCSEIGDKETYVTVEKEMPFTVHCGTDYTGGDTLAVWMYTFADCMAACASWNAYEHSPPCYAVSYDISDAFSSERGNGNCFFKGRRNIQAYGKNVTSSADAVLSGDS
ncbi:MAG: hypothetical protein Q9169_002375 [Polycauliona sp. 2 TL-2023]